MLSALLLANCALAPVPLTDDERRVEAQADLSVMFGQQEPLKGPLTLNEAFARAMAYNLDGRLKLMEAALARDDLDLSRFDLLPKATANGSNTWRSNQDASSSTSILTDRQSLEPSTSSDRARRIADLTASWNILDLGVSYFNAKQQADRTLIAEEERRKVTHGLLQDVRQAYWRAASAQRLRSEVRQSIKDAEAALASSRRIESENLRSPVDALRYQKALLDLLRQLESIERQLAVAKTELASLINLPPGRDYVIASARAGAFPHSSRRLPVKQMEDMALLRNPDLLRASYQTRVSADETRKLFFKLLPGINLSYGSNYDSNSFLVNNYWGGAALRLTGNLMNVLQLPAQVQRAENAERVADLRRQALSIAVLAKLHIAYQQYLSAMKEYQWAAQLADVDQRLLQQIGNRVSNDAQGELEKVSARVGATTSALRRDQAYAEAQGALGRIYATLGIDVVTERDVATPNIEDLRKAIRHFGANVHEGAHKTALKADEASDAATAHAPASSTGMQATASDEAGRETQIADAADDRR